MNEKFPGKIIPQENKEEDIKDQIWSCLDNYINGKSDFPEDIFSKFGKNLSDLNEILPQAHIIRYSEGFLSNEAMDVLVEESIKDPVSTILGKLFDELIEDVKMTDINNPKFTEKESRLDYFAKKYPDEFIKANKYSEVFEKNMIEVLKKS